MVGPYLLIMLWCHICRRVVVGCLVGHPLRCGCCLHSRVRRQWKSIRPCNLRHYHQWWCMVTTMVGNCCSNHDGQLHSSSSSYLNHAGPYWLEVNSDVQSAIRTLRSVAITPQSASPLLLPPPESSSSNGGSGVCLNLKPGLEGDPGRQILHRNHTQSTALHSCRLLCKPQSDALTK
jgi:hypothetical protein